jgi:hypothetical protein
LTVQATAHRLSRATLAPHAVVATGEIECAAQQVTRPVFGCREDSPGPYAAFSPAAVRDPAPAVPPRPAGYPVERALLQADGLALSLRGALERVCIPLARAAATFVRTSAWASFGFARLNDHARERFGRSGRWVRDLAALGNALDSLPALAAALTGEDGGRPIGRVAALVIGHAASPASLAAWIALARAVPVRDLRGAVRSAHACGSTWPPGRSPLSPPDRAAPDHGASSSSDEESDAADRSLVRVPVPAPLLAAFDEAVDLYRAVEGTDASVTSFVEALVAESLAGAAHADAHAPSGDGAAPWATGVADIDRVSLRPGAGLAGVESALARSTRTWSHLPPSSAASWALALAGVSAARLEALSRQAGTGGSAELDAQVRALIALENEMEGRLGRLLAEMAERGAWSRLRFAGVGHYAEQRLGLSRSSAEDRARAARSLRRFPMLRAAYERGRIGLEATLLVLRVLGDGPIDQPTESAWLARAEEATVKRLRDEARALKRSAFLGRGRRPDPSAPAAASGPAAVSGPVTAAFGLAAVSGPAPGASAFPCDLVEAEPPCSLPGTGRHQTHPLADAEWHASLRREPGMARQRIIHGGTLAIAWADRPTVLPSPDVFLRLRLPHDIATDFLAAIESSRRALTERADSVAWDEPWPDPDELPSIRAARTFSTRSRRVPAWVGLLALLEDFVFTWDGEARTSDRQQEANARRSAGQRCPYDEPPTADPPEEDAASNLAGRQRRQPKRTRPANPVAPATPRRRGDAVYIRDGWRCTAPACTSRRNLEDHHILYRSRRGPNDLSNRTCLCRFHHALGEHGNLASCKGTAPTGITWRLGSTELAAWYRNERRVGAPA